MIIIFYDTELAANEKLDEYTDLARHSTSPNNFVLTGLNKHPSEDIWFFDASDCITHGRLGRETIQSDVDELENKFEVSGYPELISMGYIAQPDDT